ncbi:MAG: type IV pilin protein [Gaiella sp.]
MRRPTKELLMFSRHRLHDDRGFTLIELLVVLVIIGVLLAIAVPSYLGFKGRASDRTAQANIRTAMTAAETFYADNRTYVGMTEAALALIDTAVSPTLTVASAGVASYCLTDTIGGRTWSVAGPGTTPSFRANGTCS